MPGSQGTGAADVSHTPLGCPYFSLLPSKVLTLLERQESAAARCPVICGLDNQHSLTFSSKLSWSPGSDHPFLQLCSAKGADAGRMVWKVLIVPEPVVVFTVLRRTGYTSSACSELWAQTLHICSCVIIDEF